MERMHSVVSSCHPSAAAPHGQHLHLVRQEEGATQKDDEKTPYQKCYEMTLWEPEIAMKIVQTEEAGWQSLSHAMAALMISYLEKAHQLNQIQKGHVSAEMGDQHFETL